jgi:hypothetical protein
MFRFIAGLFSFKLIAYAIALYFVWTTMGTGWTLLVAWLLAAFLLWKWGPDEPKDGSQPWTLWPTRGKLFAIVAPLALCLMWPLSVLAAVTPGEKS